MRRALPIVAWLVVLAGIVVGMLTLGMPDLHAPPPEAVMGVLRLVVLALAAYLFVVTAVAIVFRMLHAGRLVTLADVVTLPVVRAGVQAALGVGIVGSAAVLVAPTPLRTTPTAADMHLAADVDDDAPPVLQRIDAAPVPVAEPAPAPTPTWTVAPGDHLWSISSRVLTSAWGRPPADVEVVPYWERVIDENRTRLADPANPDLLFPGQVLVVPSPPPSP